MTTTEQRQEIAATIIRQIGGTQSRMRVMIGVKQFSVGDDMNGNVYVGIKFSAKSANKANYVSITLDPSDTYTMSFKSIRGMKITDKGEFSGLFGDQLKEIFESETQLYLSL